MPVFALTEDLAFPPPHRARRDGLLAIGGDLSVQRLLLAYRSGIFPWYSEGDPILWWSPDPRLVFIPDEFRVSTSLRRVIRSGRFTVTMDTAFREIITACADTRGPGRDGTWITPEMAGAYCALHNAGYAHSVECWEAGELAGGLYGVSLGAAFFGESMFSRVSNASKVALAALVEHARAWRFSFIDCQMTTGHLLSLGAREVTRKTFLHMLEAALAAETRVGRWTSNS
ncbi:MAG: leucyl/phenylalanyl-tRNA--protein transferase [Candidatus Hydrogenedentes bacterium]|nr:leucyl/phenylalanyl-tRNA--protein transferase [Candidatus Hydrogenedentota bacterium]